MDPISPTVHNAPISASQRRFILAVAIAALVLGVRVQVRSVFLHRRMTDIGCYLRAAWAIRAGTDPYAVTCDNHWHYNYPPFLAVLLGPLADPPPGFPTIHALPYATSVAVWYCVGVVALLTAVHLLALVLETELPQPPRRFGCSWWALRLGPLALALPAAGRTLGRGQVNTIVLALLAGWLMGVVRGRRLTGGVCLAFAICIKVIPAILLLHPLWRRDGRTLAGCTVGLGVGLIGVPAAVCGSAAMVRQTQTFLTVTLAPGLGIGHDETRGAELTNANSADSQSPLSILHNLTHLRSWDRPPRAESWVKIVHWVFAGILTALTLLVAGRRPITRRNELGFAGALCLVMAVVSPVCHLHYFVFAVHLVAALWFGPRPRRVNVALAAFATVQTLSLFPIVEPIWTTMPIREFGFTAATTLGLWAVALTLPLPARSHLVSETTHQPLSEAARILDMS